MEKINKPRPGYLPAILRMRCPRCRKGKMFNNSNPYSKISLAHIFDMPEKCAVCEQKYDMEPGFWYGTGYVSYALTVAVSVASFIAWWVIVGLSSQDNRVLYWLAFNAVLLIVLQPWLMRMSRVIYIRFFVKYHEDYERRNPTEFE